MITNNLLSDKNLSWFDIQEPLSSDFEQLSSEFSLPHLLLQDTLRPEHLPKYESTEDGHFLMLRCFDPEQGKLATTVQELSRKIALFISHEKLLTIHRSELQYLNKIKNKCQRKDVPDSIQGLVHLLVLSTIRTYEDPIDAIQEMYEEFETEVLGSKAEKLNINRIYHFRRQTFLIKRILKQTTDALSRSRDFWENHPSMLQDLKENLDQLYFQLDEVSDNFEHLFALHVALNDQRANDVMKVLTVFSSVLLPLNFLASFYGMNFKELPGLDSFHALITLVLAMLLLSILSIWYFKSKGWFRTSDE